jgi:D-alanyl-D-alanine carboxypeptidase
MVVDAETGAVIEAVAPHMPWHPASLTKLMTAYVALAAVRQGRVRLDSMFVVSPLAAAQAPSKMGFRPGTEVSLDAALYMLMVKSANDVSVTVAEGVSGSLEAFVAEMNATSRRLGMTGSVWRNPNGLPDPDQVTTARDLAVLARALMRDFPAEQRYFRAQAIQYGRATMRNYNQLIGRYPGADGMKTGFVCSSGFNLIGSATRNGRRHIAVVLGANSGRGRSERAATLLERSFGAARAADAWFGGQQRPTLDQVVRAADASLLAPDLRQEICVQRRGRFPSESEELAPQAQPAEAGAVMSLAEQTPALAGAAGAVAAARAAAPRAPLIAPIPDRVTAVVIGRSVVNPRERRPLRVAVVGVAPAGRGLAPPALAMTAQRIGEPADPLRGTAAAAAVAAVGAAAVAPVPPGRPAAAPAARQRTGAQRARQARAAQQRRAQAAQQQRRQVQQRRTSAPASQPRS